jgi:hypothetical protein
VRTAPFRFDRTWRFDATVNELWDAIADTRTYPAIWSWLREFDCGPLVVGTAASFTVQPPLPYSLHFVVTVDEVVPHERIDASVAGDVRGPAQLLVTPTADGGSQARITWSLELVRPTLRRVEPLARRPMIWGHDLVVAIGVRQFRRTALRAPG